MFEGRFPELLIIFVVALVVLGPQKLPQVAALVGRWLGSARAMARQFRDQLEEEAHNMQRPVADPAPPTLTPTPPLPPPPVVTEYSPTSNPSSDERGV
jgi:Tat protein translocase TatB subunit